MVHPVKIKLTTNDLIGYFTKYYYKQSALSWFWINLFNNYDNKVLSIKAIS